MHKPEYHQHEEFLLRTNKLNSFKEMGIEPYPHVYEPTHDSKKLHEANEGKEIGHSEEAADGTTEFVRMAGRLVLFRSMGKNAFGHIQDHTGRIQVMFNRDLTKLEGLDPSTSSGEEVVSPHKLIEKKIDLGDILGVEGHLFRTNKGELTLFAKKVTLLCKTLLPLADKHAGLADKELRYRKRWLDLITNDDVKKVFLLRSQIMTLIRRYFEVAGFLEVETPIMQSIYGGAEARPFITKLNALDQEMFMRISLEIPLKKLIVGGFDKVYEVGKVFRNEGIDRSHNPEFTLLEAYAAYWDYNKVMSFVENLFAYLAMSLYGTTIVPVRMHEGDEPVAINLAAPWPRLTMKQCIEKFTEYKIDAMSDEELRTVLLNSGHVAPDKVKQLSRGLLIAALFEVFAEPHLIQPHHVIDHPIETTPLCKLHRDPEQKKQGIVERFESFILGGEICNAYTELNDPELQRTLLEQQATRREMGDEEASPLDEEFIEAICQGMPPTGGFGIGIDRLVMILTNSHSIRDVLFFPWMKPQ